MRHPPLVALCAIMMLTLVTFGYTSGDRDACVIDDGVVVDRTSGTNQLDVAYVVAVTNGSYARGAVSMERRDNVSMKYTLILVSTSDDPSKNSGASDAVNAMLKDGVDAIGWSTGAVAMSDGGGTLHNNRV